MNCDAQDSISGADPGMGWSSPGPSFWQLNHANSAYFGTLSANFLPISTLGCFFLQSLDPALQTCMFDVKHWWCGSPVREIYVLGRREGKRMYRQETPSQCSRVDSPGQVSALAQPRDPPSSAALYFLGSPDYHSVIWKYPPLLLPYSLSQGLCYGNHALVWNVFSLTQQESDNWFPFRTEASLFRTSACELIFGLAHP